MIIEPVNVGLEDFPASTVDSEGIIDIDAVMDNMTARTYVNVPYVTRDGLTLHLHIIVPNVQPMKLVPDPATYPLVVYVQGSAWFVQQTGHNIASLGEISRKGYVVAIVEYRPSTVAPFPAQIQDTKTAIRFLREHADEYKIDPTKVVIWGDSSGGHTALMTGITASRKFFDLEPESENSCEVLGIVDYYGPVLVSTMNEEPSTQDHITPKSPEGMILGHVNVLEHKEEAYQMSPLPYIEKDVPLPPVVIFHGDHDRLVPFGQSVLFYNKLKECDKEVTFYRVKGADHGTAAFWNDEVLTLTEQYLSKWTKR